MLDHLRSHPALTGFIGSISGWASFDFLSSSQIAAAFLASLVSIGTLVIIAPKILDAIMLLPEKVAKFREWLRR